MDILSNFLTKQTGNNKWWQLTKPSTLAKYNIPPVVHSTINGCMQWINTTTCMYVVFILSVRELQCSGTS